MEFLKKEVKKFLEQIGFSSALFALMVKQRDMVFV